MNPSSKVNVSLIFTFRPLPPDVQGQSLEVNIPTINAFFKSPIGDLGVNQQIHQMTIATEES
jgi:hypothetical protein